MENQNQVPPQTQALASQVPTSPIQPLSPEPKHKGKIWKIVGIILISVTVIFSLLVWYSSRLENQDQNLSNNSQNNNMNTPTANSIAMNNSTKLVLQADSIFKIAVFSDSGLIKDVKVSVNGNPYDSSYFYSGDSSTTGKNTYGQDSLKPVPLLADAANTISFSQSADYDFRATRPEFIKTPTYIPVVFQIYLNNQLAFTVIGGYKPGDAVQHTIQIPQLKDIASGQYFFFPDLPVKDVLYYTLGNATLKTRTTSKSEPDSVQVSLLTKAPSSRWIAFTEESPSKKSLFTKPYFAYLRTDTGVVYEHFLSPDEVLPDAKKLDFNITATDFSKQSFSGAPVTDAAQLDKVKIAAVQAVAYFAENEAKMTADPTTYGPMLYNYLYGIDPLGSWTDMEISDLLLNSKNIQQHPDQFNFSAQTLEKNIVVTYALKDGSQSVSYLLTNNNGIITPVVLQ
jgi:hypothetical protein